MFQSVLLFYRRLVGSFGNPEQFALNRTSEYKCECTYYHFVFKLYLGKVKYHKAQSLDQRYKRGLIHFFSPKLCMTIRCIFLVGHMK